MKKKNILLTGSESFIASFLIKKLEKKYNVIGIDNIKTRKTTKLILDINSPKILKLKFKIDYIIHLAAVSRDKDCKENPIDCMKTNILGTLNLIELANKKKIKNFIFASTQWVYNFKSFKEKNESDLIDISKVKSEYSLSKLVSENNLKQNYETKNLNTTILRFGIIYGPRFKNLSAVESIFYNSIENNKIEVGSLKTARNFIHVYDICSAIVKSLNVKGFNILNLEGDKLIDLNKLLDISEKILKKKIIKIEKNKLSRSIRSVSNKKAKRILNWHPKYDIYKGLTDLYKFYKKNKT
tara:strand:+ start:486 stop:1376 length:891 start_codon:yes stop_codon:yes gene_type:complete